METNYREFVKVQVAQLREEVGGWVQADASFAWDAGGWVQSDLLAAWRVGDLSASPARFSVVDLTAQLAASVDVAQLTAAIPSAGMTAYRG